MSQNNQPPFIVGLLGAVLALGIVRGIDSITSVDIFAVIGLVIVVGGSIVGLYVFIRFVFGRVASWQQEKEWYNRLDSKAVSVYYRWRGRVLSRLGIIGR